MAQNSWVGKTLSDRYKIEELLGQGGMSAVYKATDPNLRRVVAVKMIHQHLSADNEFVRRFEEEATAVAQLRHTNIIQVYDFNQDDGTYYMVLEFVPGETLQERLKRLNTEGRRMSFEEAAKFTINVCEAADYAHKRGMIHRDIKPANVMLDIHGQAILMDFGIAKIVGGEQHTATGAVIGTALYMAPEQIRGEKIDERVDVYATGVTLFEMLNGKPPYEADSAMTLMMKHLNDPIPDLRDLQPGVPENLVAVVEKALTKDRAQRYKNAAEMASDLRIVLDRLQSPGSEIAKVLEATEKSEAEALVDEDTTIASNIPAAVGAVAAVTPSKAANVDADTPAVTSTVPDSQGTGTNRTIDEGAPPAAATPQKGIPARRPNFTLIGGGLALVLILLCTIVGGVYAYNQFSNNGDGDIAVATQAEVAVALLSSPTSEEPIDTAEPTATFTDAPPTVTPTPEDTPTPTLSPTPTVPPGILYVRINDISLDSEGNYLVDYEVFEFTDEVLLDGYHLTFFFDDTPPDQVGSPYDTLYYMYAGPSPFTKFNLGFRSNVAKQICALVTRPDHTVVPESGNCFPMPELEADMQLKLEEISSYTPTPTPTIVIKEEKEKKDKNKDPGY